MQLHTDYTYILPNNELTACIPSPDVGEVSSAGGGGARTRKAGVRHAVLE